MARWSNGKLILFLAALLLFTGLIGSGPAAAQIPSTLGWYSIPNSHMRDVCPSSTSFGNCAQVVQAWGGGAVDTSRNRLIIWGGGHTDYYGNELYALDLNSLKFQRLTDPGPREPNAETLSDGTPNSRHTYDGLAYMEHVDRLFSFGGSLAGGGNCTGATWTFDFSTMKWRNMNPSNSPSGRCGAVSAYDPNTRQVFVHDGDNLYAYTFETNSYRQLSGYNEIDYHMTAAIDPVRKKFVIVGGGWASNGGVYVYDIGPGSNYTRERWSTTGGDAIVNAASPGLAYDPVSDRIVAWSGGNTVYSLNMDTREWTAKSYSGGPGAPPSEGTFSRWDYVPRLGVFVGVNNVDANAFTLRLSSGSTPLPTPTPPPSSSDTTLPTLSITAPANGSTVSGSAVTVSANASDNVGVARVEFYVDGALKATDTSSAYSFTWDTTQASNASHIVMAKVFDAAGNSAEQQISVTVSNGPALTCNQVGNNNFVGCYYDNADFTNLVLTRTDNQINFDWGTGSPDPKIGPDTFSVRWQGNFTFAAGDYVFTVRADDGIRLFVDGTLLIDKWVDQSATTYQATKTVTAGSHLIKLEYYENGIDAAATLSWVAADSPSPTPTPAPSTAWTLVWSDEFDYTGLPNSAKWDYEVGRVRNNEAQYYTRARSENARVENGTLVIEARKESYQGAGYTAASLMTKGKASWTYGRMEVRAKLPKGRGVWPAIWTLSPTLGWLAGGEIDIMEYVGFDPDTIYSNVHGRKDGSHYQSGPESYSLSRPYDNFHVYTLEWFPDRMDFFIDGNKHYTYSNNGSNPWPFDQAQYLILNLAIGGSWGGQQGIDDSIFPQQYVIDYVRVYQQGAGTPPPSPTDTTPPTVSVAAPAGGATVSGTAVTLSANASDNVGVAGVQFRVDGVNAGAEDTTAPYSMTWDSTTMPNGQHTITAVARDAAGNTATTAVNLVVSNVASDGTAPTVSLTAPTQAAALSGIVGVSSTASDNVGVVGVQFKLDGQNLGAEDTTAPYSVSWNTASVANGSHTLTAVARDAAGNQKTSTAVVVNVSNTAPTPLSVSITAPSSGSTVSGSVNIAANYQGSVVGVQFKLNGANLGPEDTSNAYSYTWDTRTISDGTYALTAVARDAAGSTATSPAVSVVVSNSTSPTGRRLQINPSNADAGCNEEFENLANSLKPGDELVLRGGVYSQTCRRAITVNGTAAAPITIRAADGEVPILTRPDPPGHSYPQNNIEISGSYLIIRGLHFKGGDLGVRIDGGHHITFEDNEIYEAGSSGLTLNSGDTDSFIIRRNHIHHTGLDTTVSTEGEGMYVGCNNKGCIASNHLIEGNYIHHTRGTSAGGNDGIEVKVGSFGNIIRNNVIHDTTIGSRFPCIFVYGGGSGVNTVEGNAMWNCGEAIQVVSDAIVRNNIILNSDTGITAASHSQVAGMKNVSIVNNTIYGHSAECLYVRWSGATNMLLVNNAVYCPGKTAVNASGLSGGGVTVRSNYVEGSLSGASIDNVGFLSGGSASAAFGNPAGLDFWAKPSSPLIATANATFAPPLDFNGTTRVGPYDVGAYETNGQPANPGWKLSAGFKTGGGTSPPPSADSTPPTVAVSAPTSDSTVSDTVTVSANASDNVGVAGVRFKLDGALIGPEDTTSPYSYSWNTTTAANGPHTLTAVARDAAGNTTTSAPLSVNVSNALSDGTPPVVSLSAPATGTTVSGAVTISASASDNVGIAGVQFKLDGVLIGPEDTANPYSYSWNTTTVANGSHTLTAVARDAAGNATTSVPVSVTVSNATTPSDTTPPVVSLSAPAVGTVSGLVAVSANASDNVGVIGVQFKLNGVSLGPEDATTPFSVSWNTATVANGSHMLTAVARDAAGNTTTSASLSVNVSNGQSTPPPPAPTTANTVTIYNTVGATQTNRPVSISRVFRQGELPNFAQASINGISVLTQTDVKNRWPDGSLKFAIVSFVIPNLPANSSVTVAFSNQATGNNTGYLTQAEMLSPGFDFEGTIVMGGANTQTVNARQMLTNGHFRYWLQGPIVTAIVLEDRTTARSYDKDFGDGSKALHPIFEAWFYPANSSVELGYTVENTWASNTPQKGMRDLTYGLTLKAGLTAQATKFTHPSFNHVGKTRWHKKFWLGSAPASLRVDHNLKYLVTTRAIPNYDTGIKVAESLITDTYGRWVNTDKTLDGGSVGIGNYDKDMNAGGANDWIGLMNTWDTVYLMTMDDRLREVVFGNADLAGRIPMHYRDADVQAGTGKFFDRPATGSVETFGRTISVNARKTVTLRDITYTCGSSYAADEIRTGPVSDDGWGDIVRSHMPDTAYLPYLLTGRYYYLEELQYWASYNVAQRAGCYGEAWERQGETGYLNDGEVRGDAWGFRTVAYGAFISPDGSPEKAYYEDKLGNNIAKWEGEHNVPLSDPSKQAHWNWGNTNLRNTSPLGAWRDMGKGFVESPLKTDGSVSGGASEWEEYFLISAFGMAKQFGYPTDGVLKYMARQPFNILLNPTLRPYLIEAYHYPTKMGGGWVQTWAGFLGGYSSLPTGWRTGGGRDSTDHGYGFIGLAAVSYLYDQTVDGFTGKQAWDFLKATKPEQQNFATLSPKWAILPLGTGVIPPPPSSTTDITPPTVSIAAPAQGASVSGAAVNLSAVASDNVGVVGVQFAIDGVNVGPEGTTNSHSIPWDTRTVSNGSHTLTAVARDAAGNTKTATVTVTVSNATSDTAPPAVAFTAPASGATVSGAAVTLSATASDDRGVVGVQFKVDGVNLGPEDTTNNYSIAWDTRGVSNGPHSISVTARDAAGNTKTASMQVTVSNATPDTTPPTVAVTAPAAGGAVSGASVTLSATASDNVGVVGVQFKVDGVNVGAEDTTAPYSVAWNSTPVANGSRTITAVARDAAGNTKTSAAITITVSNSLPTPPPSTTSGSSVRVWTMSSNGGTRQASSLLAFGPALAGVVSVATGDVDGDGVAEVITGAGQDGHTSVRIWKVNAQGTVSEVASFFAYDPALSIGVYVAAGDIDGDGKAEIITGKGGKGSPHVRVWKVGAGGTISEVASFYAYDPASSGGASVAAGDVDGDGKAEIITGAGPDGGSHVRVWKIGAGAAISEVAGFSAYGTSASKRVFVAAGDIDGDGKAEIITGHNGNSRVRVWKVGAGGAITRVASFYAYDSAYQGGVSVAAGDVDGDGKAEIITGPGPNGSSQIRVWKVGAGKAVSELTGFSAYDSSYNRRVYVGAGQVAGDGIAEIVTGTAALTTTP